jgi:hypothetical protein
MRDITGIPSSALRNMHLSAYTTSEHESSVRNREIRYEESIAYLLLRIFDVRLRLCYGGDRERAQRLREEIENSVKVRHCFVVSDVPR